MPADVPDTSRPHRTSSYELQLPDGTTRRPPSTTASSPTPTINTDRTPERPLPSSSTASASAETAPEPTTTALNPNTPIKISLTTATISDVDSSMPVLIATALLLHASAWWVTCESVSQRLANQCVEHPHTFDPNVTTALTVRAHSPTAWAY
ncbi:hypothetical protein SprV_0200879600 [Sparganum proliferum]